jgi:hypothetical protein
MPQRTNTFQQILTLVYWLMAEGEVTVEESAMLPDKDTGKLREVDVLVTGAVADLPMRVQIEATTQAGPVDVKWVEMELGLHRSVQTDRLILVSDSGFSGPARKKAEAEGAVPIEPKDFDSDDAVGEIVNRLGTIYPKMLFLMPEEIVGLIERQDGEIARAVGLDLTTQIFTETGLNLGTIDSEIRRRMNSNFKQTAEEIGLPNIAGDADAKFVLGMPDWIGQADGGAFRACLRWEEVDPPEFHRLIEVRVQGKAEIRVGEIDLTHKKLGKYSLAYGTGRLGDGEILVVITEGEAGNKAAMKGLA